MADTHLDVSTANALLTRVYLCLHVFMCRRECLPALDVGHLFSRRVHSARHVDEQCYRRLPFPRVGMSGYRGHATVRLPGVLHTNIGHSKFGYRTF